MKLNVIVSRNRMEYDKLKSYLALKHDHESILRYMMEEKIRLPHKNEAGDTCLDLILKNVTDPFFLIKKYLDRQLSTVVFTDSENYIEVPEDEIMDWYNHPEFRIRVDIQDFEQDGVGTDVFKILQDFQIDTTVRFPFASGYFFMRDTVTRKNLEDSNLLSLLINHPVIVSYLRYRVTKMGLLIVLLGIIYFTFLVAFSVYVQELAFEHATHEDGIDKKGGYLLFSGSLLIIYQLCQAFTLRFRVLLDLENLFSVTTVLCCFGSLALQSTDMVIAKKFCAVGVTVGWIELLFLLGKCHPCLANVSYRLLSAVRNVLKYTWAWVLILIGFNFAFQVVLHEDYFQDMIMKNQTENGKMAVFVVKMMTMTIGEFDFTDFAQGLEDDYRILGFILFILLILMLTISMLNIFIAVIVFDQGAVATSLLHEKLFQLLNFTMTANVVADLVHQMTLRMARFWMIDRVKKDVVPELFVCIHRWCRCNLKDQIRSLYFPEEFIEVENSLRRRLKLDQKPECINGLFCTVDGAAIS